MTNLSFIMAQRDRLTADTPAERAIRSSRFANARSSDETEGARAGDEYVIAPPRHAWKGMVIHHPLNYLWAMCMGRQM